MGQLDPGREASGGAPLDLHIHDADTVQWYFGRPERVSTVGTEDAKAMGHIVATYHYADGPVVVAEGGWDYPASFPFRMEAGLVFEKAAVAFSTMTSPALTVYEEGAEAPLHPKVPVQDGYTEELRYFVGCVAEGKQPDRIAPEEAVSAVAIVEAEIESARSGKPVAIKA